MKEVYKLSNISLLANILKNRFTLYALGLLSAFFLFTLITNFFNYESTDNAYVDANITTISSQVNGNILEIYYQNNEEVHKDTVLAKIDESDYVIALNKANAVLEQATSNIDITKQKISLALLSIKEAEKAIQLSKVNLAVAQNDLDRVGSLTSDQFSSKKTFDAANASFESAKFARDKTLIALDSANQDLKLLELENVVNISKLEEAKQAKLFAENQLSDTVIKAPIAGIVADSFLIVGNFAKIGAPLVSIVPTEMHIQANFKETQVNNINPGMSVEIKIDGVHEKLKGTVRNSSPATGSKFSLLPTDNAVGNFTKVVQRVPVYIDFEIPANLKGKIVPGMSVYVKIKKK